MRQTKQQAAQAKQRGAGDKNTFSVDGIRRHPCGQQKLPKVSIKPLVSHDSAAGEPPSDCCIAGVVMTPPVKLNGSSKAAIKTESAAVALAYREGVLAVSNIGRPSSVGKKE